MTKKTVGRKKTQEQKSLKIRRWKKIIQLLQEQSLTPLEMIQKTRFPPKSVYRYLDDLFYLGLTKQKGGRWFWYSHLKRNNENDEARDLQHSKKLVLGLRAILSETHQGESWALKNEAQGGLKIKPFMEQHLKTGYPLIFQRLEAYREWREKTRVILQQKGCPKKKITSILDGVESFPDVITEITWEPPEELMEIVQQKLEMDCELEKILRGLENQVIIGYKPLDGCCEACETRV
jgi:hypothetical protein